MQLTPVPGLPGVVQINGRGGHYREVEPGHFMPCKKQPWHTAELHVLPQAKPRINAHTIADEHADEITRLETEAIQAANAIGIARLYNARRTLRAALRDYVNASANRSDKIARLQIAQRVALSFNA